MSSIVPHTRSPFIVSLQRTSAWALGILLPLASAPAAHATVIDWSSTAGSTAWATGTNWLGNTAPANNTTTDIARFNQTSYVNQPNAGTRSIAGIQIGDGSTATAALTLTTSTLSVGAGGITMNTNAGAATIGKIATTASQTWANNSSSILTFNGANAFAHQVIFDGTGSIVLSGASVVSNSSILIKNGSGSLTLGGSNNFSTGGLTLNAGTLFINDNSALADGTGSNATFTINGGNIDNTSGAPIGIGDIKMVWNSDFTFLASRTLDLGTGNVTLGSATGTTRTITTNGGINQELEIGGIISNGTTANSLIKAGTGALRLTGNNTYSGLTTLSMGTLYLMGANSGAGGVRVDSGTLILGNNSALGTGTLTMNGGHLDVTAARTLANNQVWNGDFTFDGTSSLTLNGNISLGTAAGASRTLNIASNLVTIYGIISNGVTATSLIKTGAGDLDLRAINTFSGGLTFGNGTLWLSNAGAVGTGVLTINDGAILDNYNAAGITTTNNGLVINGNFTSLGRQLLLTLGTGAANLGTAPGTTRTITTEGGNSRVLAINNNIANGTTAKGIVKAGIGELTLGGNNTFDGGVTLTNGKLNINNAGALGTGTFVIEGGSFANTSGAAITNSNNNAQIWNTDVVGGVSSATNSINLGTGTVSLGSTSTDSVRIINPGGNASGTLTVGGTIHNGTGNVTTGIVKTGAAVLTLTGNNTYTGTTTINQGTANFSGSNSGGGAVIVTGDIDAGTSGIMNINGSAGQFTSTTSYTVTGAGILNVGDATTGMANRLNVGATLSLGGAEGAGAFNLVRGSATANNQSLVSLIIGEGSNTISASSNSGAVATLTFTGPTPYSRSAGGFVNFANNLTVNFSQTPSGAGNVAAGLLVGGILNGTDFIRAQSGNLTATVYTADAWSSGNNTNVTTGNTLSNATTGSLRFNTSGNQTLTLSGTNTIQSGGILIGTSASATSSGTITGGSLQTGSAGGDLWVYINSGRGLTINSAITDNSGSSLSVGGAGTLTLTGANTYTGRTTIGTGATLAYDRATGITVNNVQGTGILRNNNTSGTLTLNQTASGLSLGTVAGVSGSTVIFTGTGSTTLKTSLNSAGQSVHFTGGTVSIASSNTTQSNLLVNGGTLNFANTFQITNAAGSQTLDITSGQLNALNHVFLRANGVGSAFIANQSGGTFTTSDSTAYQFQLGTATANAASSTYNLSGGTLRNLGTGGLIIYADTGGNSTGTFNLSGGTLLNASSISGNQAAGAKQAFVWTGGTLATFGYNAANLTDTAATGVVTGVTNVLTNDGGTLAAGDIGITGRTIITGKYNVTSDDAVLDIDIAGDTASTVFQDAPGTGHHDQIVVSGTGNTATLGGKLNVRLLDGYDASNDSFVILTTANTPDGVSGTFTNLTASLSGSRIVLADGLSSFNVTFNANNVLLDSFSAGNEWYGNGSSSGVFWSDSSMWSTFIPSMAGHIAKFADNIGLPGDQTVTLDINETVGGIQFDSTYASYTLDAAPGTVLTLDNNGAASTISSVGTHAISAPIALANNLTVNTTGSTDSLVIAGAISGSGKSLTKTGDGLLALNGANTYTGATIVSTGTLLVNGSTGSGGLALAASALLGGAGSVGGTSTLGGTVNPGDAAGNATLTFTGPVTLQASSVVHLDITAAGTRGTDYDGINFNGTLILSGGTLSLSIGSLIADNTTLNLFDLTTVTGAFASVVATDGVYLGTFLQSGNSYSGTFGSQTVTFNLSTGDLSFAAAIPEPGACAALVSLLVLAGATFRRRARIQA